MGNLKVTKLANGLLDVRVTLTEEQFEAIRLLATDLYAEPELVIEPQDAPVTVVFDPGDVSFGNMVKTVLSKPLHGICDDCGEGMMIERTNSTTGHTFLGCSEFPECKFTKSGGKNPAPPRVSSYSDDMFEDDDFDTDWDGMPY
jgi:hypothetical protein